MCSVHAVRAQCTGSPKVNKHIRGLSPGPLSKEQGAQPRHNKCWPDHLLSHSRVPLHGRGTTAAPTKRPVYVATSKACDDTLCSLVKLIHVLCDCRTPSTLMMVLGQCWYLRRVCAPHTCTFRRGSLWNLSLRLSSSEHHLQPSAALRSPSFSTHCDPLQLPGSPH